jgi:uncharacterized membrane protein (UPF0127 family)
MRLHNFVYYEGKKKIKVRVGLCDNFFRKFTGLMFNKNSPPLLFLFDYERRLSIHSFFCKPFIAIWLNKHRRITQKVYITRWLFNISGKGKYLLEIPLKK